VEEFKMKKIRVDVKKVISSLIRGQQGKEVDFSNLSETKIRKLVKFPEDSWEELFNDEKTLWYKTELDPKTNFINKIFDSGKGFMTHIGLSHDELLKNYKNGKMSKEFILRIDEIKKKLNKNPRIVVLTKDFKEYSIVDGGRRALAFRLKNKKIPVYIGFRTKFKSLKHLN
jgi:hypothetical protein